MFEPDILRISDLAAYLRVSKSTVQRYLKKGFIPYSKIGNIIYIKKDDVIAFIESNKLVRTRENFDDAVAISNIINYNKDTQVYDRSDGK